MPRTVFAPSLIGETHGCWTCIAAAGKKGKQYMWTCRASCCGRVKDICTHTFAKKLPHPERCAKCYTQWLRDERTERRRVHEATGKWPPKYELSARARKKARERTAETRMTRWEEGVCSYCPRPRYGRTHYCELHRAIKMERCRMHRVQLQLLEEEERSTRPVGRAAE